MPTRIRRGFEHVSPPLDVQPHFYAACTDTEMTANLAVNGHSNVVERPLFTVEKLPLNAPPRSQLGKLPSLKAGSK